MFRHKLSPKKTLLVKQHPKAINEGAFHNDVVCTADQNILFYHELAFAESHTVLQKIKKALAPQKLLQIKVREKQISLKEVVRSYLFNSQLLPAPDNKKNQPKKWILIAPDGCQKLRAVKDYLQYLTTSTPIKKVHFVLLNQSMIYGGGPACLRLRVVLTPEEVKHIHQGVLLTPQLYQQLKKWIHKYYRDRLSPAELIDPLLIRESKEALQALSNILKLKNIYSFQK